MAVPSKYIIAEEKRKSKKVMKMEYITKVKEYPDGSVVKTHSPVLTDKEREIAFSILNSAVRSYAREMFKANSNTNVVA